MNMQIYGFSEKPFIFYLVTKWGTRGIIWPFPFAKAQCESCDVCHFQVSSSHSGKKKKRKKVKKDLNSSQYIIWTIFGTWKFFSKGKLVHRVAVSLKKDFVFPSRYYIILYPTVGTLLKNLEIFVGF